MRLVEILGVITGILCVVLASRKNILSWPIGIINVLCYLYIFYDVKLYADFGEQIFYMFTQVMGWIYWAKNKNKKTNLIVHIDKIGIPKFIIIIASGVLVGYYVGNFLRQFTDASYPHIDAITTVSSFAAQLLLTFKKKETWIIWIVIDIVGLWLYTIKGLHLTTGLYAIYLGNAVYGLIQWQKDYNDRNRNREISSAT